MTAPVVVVGAGLAGAAAAWRLAEAGREVVLVEAVAPAHRGGSSHGSARIFRHAYADPFWVDLTVRALAGWRELEAAAGEPLLTTTGGLDFGAGRDLAAIGAALSGAGLAHEVLDAAEAARRFPHLVFDGPALHQPDAGVIDAERAVAAMVALADRAGAELRQGDPVVRVEAAAGGAVVHLRDGAPVAASTVVVAAGPWLPELAGALPGGIAARLPSLVVTQQQAFHFPFPDDRGGEWPVFVHEDAGNVYSLPGGRDAGSAGFKIAEHDRGAVTTASSRDGVVDPGSRERILDWVRRRMPGVPHEPYAETSCLYTSTPDEDFVLDRVGPVVVASPCSGHGAKFAPLLGELIARAVTDGDAPDRFRLAAPLAAAA